MSEFVERGGMRVRLWAFVVCAVVVVCLGLVFPSEARAANFEVTNGNDSGNGSLRAAITTANSNGQADTITFASNVQTVTLTGGSLEVSSDGGNGLTIDGGSDVTVTDTNDDDLSAFFTQSGSEVRITELTISDSVDSGIFNAGMLTVEDSTFSENSARNGGGIYNAGTLTVADSTFSDNSAEFGGGIFSVGTLGVQNSTFSGNSADSGGGIYNRGTLGVEDSTFSGNSADTFFGGGIFNEEGGTLTVEDSTFSENFADFNGGGINSIGTLTVEDSTFSENSADSVGGGILSATSGYGTNGEPPEKRTSITNSTFSGNRASVRGGAIYNRNGYTEINYSTITDNSSPVGAGVSSFGDETTGTRITASIVTGNTSDSGAADDVSNISGDRPYESGGYNLVGGGGRAGDFTAQGDQTGVTVEEAFGTATPTLEDNGGPTQTVVLEEGALAINYVTSQTDPTTPAADQRGVERPQGPDPDTGSYEFDAPTITISPEELPDATEDESYSQQLSAMGSSGEYTFTITDGELPDGLTLTEEGLISGTPTEEATTQTFTVQAEDQSGFTGEQEYTLTVNEVSNEGPSISDVPDQRIRENTQTGPLPFTVTDSDDPSSDLTVTGTSSNTSLVRQSGIVISGSVERRTVNVTPVRNQTGSARITLTVEDTEGLMDTETFTVRVTQTPEPPQSNECTITGTQKDDVLRGTPGRDVICGLGGDDSLIGGDGNDILRGGSGDDSLKGGAGDDRLIGGPGRDALDGGSGNNTLKQ